MVYLGIILFVILEKTGWRTREEREGYMDPSQTMAVNGIAVLFVFYRHLSQYRTLEGPIFAAMEWLDGYLGQLIVVPFLFFSGYGIMESVKRRGTDYVKRIPLSRVVPTWIRFVLTVIPYLLLSWILGTEVSRQEIFFAFLGWESLGNSNWYIFVINLLYLTTWLAFLCSGRKYGKGNVLQIVFSLFVLFILRHVREPYWYNTMMAYSAGMFFSLIRVRWDSWLDSSGVREGGVWIFAILALGGCFLFRTSLAAYECAVILVCVLMVLVMRHIMWKGQISMWLGKNLFGLYMMQRLPMILWKDAGIGNGEYALLCASVTLILGWLAQWFTKKVSDEIGGFLVKPEISAESI